MLRFSYVGIAPAVRLVRPHACCAASVETYLGAFLVGGGMDIRRAGTAMVAVALVVGAANAHNDAVDSEADHISAPSRPIPEGRLSQRFAYFFAAALAAMAVAVASILGAALTLVATGLLLLSVAYSHLLKRIVLVGNLTVAGTSAMAVPFGAWAIGHIEMIVLVPTVGVFLYIASFEVLKTVRDARADSSVGISTVATRWGDKVTLAIGTGLIIGLIVFLLLGGLLSAYRLGYFMLLAIALAPLLWAAFRKLRSQPAEQSIGPALRLLRLGWVPALLMMFML